MKVIFRNKISGDLVMKVKNGYAILSDVNDEGVMYTSILSAKTVISSDDWEIISPSGSRKFKMCVENNTVYYVDIATEQEFRIGDKVKLNGNTSYPDGKRDYIIVSFHNSTQKITNNEFMYVYANTENNRQINLCDLLK
jgi:outer membrane receptor for monomeric catechols